MTHNWNSLKESHEILFPYILVWLLILYDKNAHYKTEHCNKIFNSATKEKFPEKSK